jgi:uncharacterized protein YbjT (DUF2867 family)
MNDPRVAFVLGASGSVGQALVAELVRSAAFAPIVTLVRSSQPALLEMAKAAGVELREVVVPDMRPASLEAATADAARASQGTVVGFSVLGVGAGTAKLTLAEHRAIDVELNAAFARGLKASGRTRHLNFMSAVGADPAASTEGSGAAGMARYRRVKGESEEAVKASGLPVVSIFRPSTIVGSQHTPGVLAALVPITDFVTPRRLRSITVTQIAKAMVAAGRKTPATSGVYYRDEMVALGG